MLARWLAVDLVGTLLGLAGCSSKEVIPVENDVEAVLRGTVTRQDGSGEPETQMAVTIFRHPDCSGSPLGPLAVGPTRAGGVYGPGRLGDPLTAPFQGCLVVSADPPDSTGLKPDTMFGISVRFRDTDPLDTATVDFVLEPK